MENKNIELANKVFLDTPKFFGEFKEELLRKWRNEEPLNMENIPFRDDLVLE